jgi:quinol monooxygenase YgiN
VTSSEPPDAVPIRHVVHIRVDPNVGEGQRDALETDLRRLVEEHPHAVRATLHHDLGRRPAAPVSATWMVCLDFMSMADFESYLTSPAHKDFLETHQPSMAFITAIQVPMEGFAGAW